MIHIIETAADARDAEDLNVKPGSRVVETLRLRRADGEPVVLERNRYSMAFAYLEDEDLKHLDVRQTLYLTDVRGYTAVDSVPAVFRYQPVYRLKEELMRLQTCITDAGAPDEQAVFRTSFIGVQSPAGRTGKTGFALVLGILLAQTSKVLYMNLEPFSGLEAWFGESAEGGLSDLLFSMEVRGKDFPLEGCMREFHGLSWIPPARMAEDILKCLKKTCLIIKPCWNPLISSIGKIGQFMVNAVV